MSIFSDFKRSQKIFKGQLSVSQLRHGRVLQLIQQKQIQTLIDLGMCQGSLLNKIQMEDIVKHIIGIDIDQKTVQKAIQKIRPCIIKQIQRNYDQLVQLYHGNATIKYPQLKQLKIDLITMVELIQHVPLQQVQKIMENVFGYLKPKYIFISTPNIEFNIVFERDRTGIFRHHDHKFQWTREQFNNFVNNICNQFPYKAQISGVGRPVNQKYQNVGFCSQIGIFQRIDYKNCQKQKLLIIQQKQDVELSAQLILKYEYINLSWINNKDQLLSNKISAIIWGFQQNTLISWYKLLEQLKNSLIVKKLKQIQDVWAYNYYLKQYIKNYFQKHPQLKVECSQQGIRKQASFERRNDRDENMQQQMQYNNEWQNKQSQMNGQQLGQIGQLTPLISRISCHQQSQNQNKIDSKKQNISMQVNSHMSSPIYRLRKNSIKKRYILNSSNKKSRSSISKSSVKSYKLDILQGQYFIKGQQQRIQIIKDALHNNKFNRNKKN